MEVKVSFLFKRGVNPATRTGSGAWDLHFPLSLPQSSHLTHLFIAYLRTPGCKGKRMGLRCNFDPYSGPFYYTGLKEEESELKTQTRDQSKVNMPSVV